MEREFYKVWLIATVAGNVLTGEGIEMRCGLSEQNAKPRGQQLQTSGVYVYSTDTGQYQDPRL